MKNLPTILILAIIILLPFVLRKKDTTVGQSDDTLVIITPHDEGIRHEFETAFSKKYEAETGRSVDIDWRVIGGTSEIVRFVQSTYTHNFRHHWEHDLKRSWNPNVQNSFMNRKLDLANSPADNPEGVEAKTAFTLSNVTCGIDVFFGGGSYDFIQQARAGTLVPFTTKEKLLELFPPEEVPVKFSGEPFYDPSSVWAGAVLSQFGIIYNEVSLQRLGIEATPASWHDLTDPRYIGEIALADPTQSGSITKAFEMIVQQQMLEDVREAGLDTNSPEAMPIVAEAWMTAMQRIQLISANARYFTDSSKKPSIDVSAGECAAGMSIDFYGRFQAETVEMRTGSKRFSYITPAGGSTVSVDPIGLFRGAPNEEIAIKFIEFVLSREGQKLWNWKPGTPEGTEKYALRRSPMHRSLYAEEFDSYRSDAGHNPYDEAGMFVYHPAWTSRLFSPLRFIIKVAFIDPHKELTSAWDAIQQAKTEGRREAATRAQLVLTNLDIVDYASASGRISDILNQRTKISEVKLARELTVHFKQRYQLAQKIAEGRKSLISIQREHLKNTPQSKKTSPAIDLPIK